MFQQYPTLMVTKLALPRLRSPHVSRAHLVAALDAGLERKMIMVAAPAGFGKTTLMAQWLADTPKGKRQKPNDTDDGSALPITFSLLPFHVAWLALDAEDNDPSRFLSHLIAAIQIHRPQVGQALLAALQSPQPPAVEHVLPALINQLAAS